MTHLSKEDHDKMVALSVDEKTAEIRAQHQRIHLATMTGTLDRGTVEDALERLDVLTEPKLVAEPTPATATTPAFNPNPFSTPATPAPTH